MKTRGLALLLIFLVSSAWGSATNIRKIDAISNTSGGSSLSVPSAGTLLITDTNTATLTGKTISGSSNTLTNLPIAANIVQEIPTGTCNGSTTSFTLANTPGASSSVLLHLDGLAMTQGAGKDYTISGATITLATACLTGQTLYAYYSKF